MNNKQRETIQKVIGMLWALSYNMDIGESISDAQNQLEVLLEEDVYE